MNSLEQTIQAIAPVDQSLEPVVRAHLDQLTKPPKSLGRLEDIAAQYCLATNTPTPKMGRKRIFTLPGITGWLRKGSRPTRRR